ncbi:MAG: hypothetical protein ACYDGN_04680 [Acidimicrobiales bacterium]
MVNSRPTGRDPVQVRGRLVDAWVSLADIDGETWYRSVVANPRADPQHVIEQVCRLP